MQSGSRPRPVTYQPYTHRPVGRPRRQRRQPRAAGGRAVAQNGLLYETLTQVAAQRESILESAMGVGSADEPLRRDRDRRPAASPPSACAWTSRPRTWPTPTPRRARTASPTSARRSCSSRSARSGFNGALCRRDGLEREARRVRRAPAASQVAGIVNDPTPDQQVYDPGNPEANAQGYVKMPNVNTVNEMADLIDESHSYQADVTAMTTAKQMYDEDSGSAE